VDGMRDPTGQIYMRNRYYNPQTGQFRQMDPIGIAGGLNAYGFADGDPVSFADPFGLCPLWMLPWPTRCKEFDDLRPSEQRWILRNMWKAERVGEITSAVYHDLAVLDVYYARYDRLLGTHNTAVDAMRHTILSCRLTLEFGPRVAQEITDAHEGPHQDGSRDPEEERNMDLHNNTVGRQLAQQTSRPENCWGLAVNADRAGALRIINDNGINPSQPSSK
jgi:RHS repeat-associated protein